MSTNEIYAVGQSISRPVPAGTKSGDPLRIGFHNCVAVTDAAKTDVAAFNTDGTVNTAYNLGGGNKHGNASTKAGGSHRVNVKAAAKPDYGAGVYWDPAATPKLTVTAGSLSLWGAVEDSAPTDNGDGSWSCVVTITPITK